MRIRDWPALAGMVLLAGCTAAMSGGPSQAVADAPDRYELSPIMKGDALEAVEVALTFRGDADGRSLVVLPTSFADQQDLWRHVSDVRIDGGTFDSGSQTDRPGTRSVTHCPGCTVTVRYRVDSAYDQTPAEYAKGGATIWSDRLGSYGEALFATIEGHQDRPASFAWRGWPAGWTRVSDLDNVSAEHTRVANIVESTLLAGPDVRRYERAIPGGTLQVGVLGEYEFDEAGYVEQLQRILSAQRAFWGDVDGPFTVNLYPIRDVPGRSSLSGTGRSDGFVIESTSNMDLPTLARLIAHEHNHTWVPRRIGTMASEPEALDYWLSEGVTDFYTGRSLVESGVWSARDFAGELDTVFMRHDASPARSLPNSAIGEGFWSDGDVQQLPYDRGQLFALLVDYRLREASGGKVDYDDLLAVMRDRWSAAATGAKPPLRQAFLDAAQELGLDIAPLVERHIERGEAIDLPSDLFAPCGTVNRVDRPEFDPGFDRAASNAAGKFAGVDPEGAAYAAGLRDGMERLAYVSSAEGNSQVPMIYRVDDGTGPRDLSWLPEGKRTISVRQFTLGPEADTDACRAILAGR